MLAERVTEAEDHGARLPDSEPDAFGWIGTGASEEAQSDRLDELLTEGFGR